MDIKQCIDDNAEIKISECEECQETAMEHTTIPKESIIPDIHSINSRNLD